MSSQLEQLKAYTTVVADTGDFKQIGAYAPRDATTNPSLILKAVSQPAYAPLLAQTVTAHRGQPLDAIVDRVLVRFGCEILNVVPGRVSTEVDARLSFDAAATVARAQRIMALYESEGIARERVLIKIAATWEGIQAAKALEHHGIHCNLTLLFSFCQAVACGESGVQLISPFVGRIHDWHKKAAGVGDLVPLGASFRNTGQILALAGCDLLTISPELLAQLQSSEAPVARALDVDAALHCDAKALSFNEASFRYALNEDAMATEKLAEGIRAFAVDAAKLDRLIQAL
jgi:transaldolase